MSYNVIYNRRFIETSRGIIATVLSGDSSVRNAAEIVRHWHIYNQELIELSADEMREWVAKAFANLPENEMFDWRGERLLGKQMAAWFTAGCKKARSLEDYLLANPDQTLQCKVHIWPSGKQQYRRTLNIQHCRTTKELKENWIDSAREVISVEKAEDPSADCYLCIGFTEPKSLLLYPVGKTSIIAKDGKRFVSAYEKGKSVTFSPCVDDAIIFESIEDAVEAVGIFSGIRFYQAKSQLLKKNLVLKATAGALDGMFIKKRTPGHLKGTWILDEAMRFARSADAIRYVKMMRKDGYPKEKTGAIILYNIARQTEEILDV